MNSLLISVHKTLVLLTKIQHLKKWAEKLRVILARVQYIPNTPRYSTRDH